MCANIAIVAVTTPAAVGGYVYENRELYGSQGGSFLKAPKILNFTETLPPVHENRTMPLHTSAHSIPKAGLSRLLQPG